MSDDCSFVVAFVDYLFKLDIYLYISMYIQAEYRRLGVIIFVLLFPVPVLSFLLLRVVFLRLRVAEEFFVYFRQTACISFIITAFHSLLIVPTEYLPAE